MDTKIFASFSGNIAPSSPVSLIAGAPFSLRISSKFLLNITEAREKNSAAVALKIAEEGITLLKNNDVLPLSKGETVTPFGLRYQRHSIQ